MHRSMLIALVAPVCLGLMAGAGQARQISGTTQSRIQNIVATAVASDGTRYTAPVNITGHTTINGRIVYTGMYSLDVPTGKKVMVEIERKNSDGSLSGMTAGKFYTNKTHQHSTWMFNVTPPLAGGGDTLSLGLLKVGLKLARFSGNPLTQIDNDGDGASDYQDADDDNDGLNDDQDADEDGDNIDDQGENCDEDGDGLPDDEDDDDQGGDGDGNGQ